VRTFEAAAGLLNSRYASRAIPMNTLFVVPRDEQFGGVASVVGHLAQYLQHQGHAVSFLHPGQTIRCKPRLTHWGFPGVELRMPPPPRTYRWLGMRTFVTLFPQTMYQITKLIRQGRIQTVNIHYPISPFFYLGLCRSLLSIKLVTSIHGADIFPAGRRRKKYSFALRFVLHRSDLIVANSQAFRRDFLNVFPDLSAKTIVIHNSVNVAELNGLMPNKAHDVQRRYVLCVASHNDKKAIDVLIQAMARIAREEPSLRLVLVGDGPLRNSLEELAVMLGLREQIEFLGAQGRTKVVELLYGCTAFVLPSRSEPFGIAIVEALACRKPVVATRVGGIPEIIEDGRNGLLVEPDNAGALAEALMKVLKDENLQKALGRNGYKTVQEHFRSEATGSAYEAVFCDMLKLDGKVVQA
jgi:glycosyltransferase involved in cell wall biosynthesis